MTSILFQRQKYSFSTLLHIKKVLLLLAHNMVPVLHHMETIRENTIDAWCPFSQLESGTLHGNKCVGPDITCNFLSDNSL